MRLVQPTGASLGTGDDYLSRVAKYVPVEVVAAYLATNRLFDVEEPALWPWAAAVFAVCWLLTPLYIWRLAGPGQAWVVHALMSSLAFPIWAFAIGGLVFTRFDFGPDVLPSILLVVFSLVAGLVTPARDDAGGIRPTLAF